MLHRQNASHRALGIVLFAALSACSPFDGELPPEDELYYPSALAMHPNGELLYVLSSNFDSEYRTDLGGTVSVIDLEDRVILADHTICLPSFGGDLLLSNTVYSDGNPRYLFAATRANDGVVGLRIDDGDPRRISCPTRNGTIYNTCVSEIEDLPDVDERQRELPCSVYNIIDDPFALGMVPNDGSRPDTLDPVAVAGIRDSSVKVINFLNGEVRGESGAGSLDRDGHLSDDVNVATGPSQLAFHPILHDMYVTPRFTTVFNRVRFLFRERPSNDGDHLDGFVATGASVGFGVIPNASTRAEVRGAVFNEAGTRLYASQQSPDSIVVIDVSLDEEGDPSDAVIDRIPLPGRPAELILDERDNRNYLYVTLFGEREIAIVDLDSLEVIRRVQVGESPYSVVLDDARNVLYVTLFAEHSIGVVDVDPGSASFGQIISTIR